MAIGGEAISRPRSPAVGKKVMDKSLKIVMSDSDEEEAAGHVDSGRKRKKKDVATGGEALDRSQEL